MNIPYLSHILKGRFQVGKICRRTPYKGGFCSMPLKKLVFATATFERCPPINLSFQVTTEHEYRNNMGDHNAVF